VPPLEPPPFVPAAWVEDRLGDVVLADVRWALDGSEGPDTYRERHLPGAVFVDLDEVLSDVGRPAVDGEPRGRHPLPDPERFAVRFGEVGIGHEDLVVAYDQGPGTMAARLVWMLRVLGERATVLDGGLAAWPGPTERGEVRRPPVVRRALPWPEDRLADAGLVDRLRHRPDAVVVDARAPERFRGEVEPVDPRPGHIPGARNLPATGNVGADGRLRDLEDLRRAYASAGALDAAEVVAYCGSGVTATHDLLVLEHLGVRGRLYPGSWSAWSADPARPVETPDTACRSERV
jgi:thiosulfate/3-mercaptopyruvate sulfurtransferase